MMEKAFDVPTYVLKHIMNGQNWLEGGEDYHRWLETAVLLIYGRQDRLVTLEEEQEMEKVNVKLTKEESERVTLHLLNMSSSSFTLIVTNIQ